MPETVSTLFYVLGLMLKLLSKKKDQKVKDTAELTLKCLQEFANVRISGFSNLEVKKSYTENFSMCLIILL